MDSLIHPPQKKKSSAQQRHFYTSPEIRGGFSEKIMVLTPVTGDFLTLRFLSTMPEADYEIARITVTKTHIRKIIDVLCKSAAYYPEKPKGDK